MQMHNFSNETQSISYDVYYIDSIMLVFKHIESNSHHNDSCILSPLTHSWGVMPIAISNVAIIGSDNDMLPGRHQAII